MWCRRVNWPLRWWVSLLLSVVLCMTHPAWGLTCRDLGGDLHVTLPGTIALRGAMMPGTMLSDFIPAEGTMRWACSVAHGESAGVFFSGMHAELPDIKKEHHGLMYSVFPTNLPAVGLLVEMTTAVETTTHTTQEGAIAVTGRSSRVGGVASGAQNGRDTEVTVSVRQARVALVSTGQRAFRTGTLQGGVVGYVGVGAGTGAGQLLQYRHAITYGGVQFVSSTCKVPDLTVIMPSLPVSRFEGVPALAGPWQPFVITVEDCPPGMEHVQYRFNRPGTGMLDETSHVMRAGAPGLASGVQGVGVQLAADNPDATIVRFGQPVDFTVPAHLSAQGGTFAIPFKARYFKPAGKTVRAGLVRAAVMFEISYE